MLPSVLTPQAALLARDAETLRNCPPGVDIPALSGMRQQPAVPAPAPGRPRSPQLTPTASDRSNSGVSAAEMVGRRSASQQESAPAVETAQDRSACASTATNVPATGS